MLLCVFSFQSGVLSRLGGGIVQDTVWLMFELGKFLLYGTAGPNLPFHFLSSLDVTCVQTLHAKQIMLTHWYSACCMMSFGSVGWAPPAYPFIAVGILLVGGCDLWPPPGSLFMSNGVRGSSRGTCVSSQALCIKSITCSFHVIFQTVYGCFHFFIYFSHIRFNVGDSMGIWDVVGFFCGGGRVFSLSGT